MKTLWEKTSDLSRYYFFSFLGFVLVWALLLLINPDFVNQVFFITAYIWHFTLLAPGMKERVVASRQKYSFLSIVVRLNHYLQLFINLRNIPFSSSLIRAISPLFFTLALLVFGGGGNLFYSLLGSVSFELFYFLMKRFLRGTSPLGHINDPEILPAIPSEEKSHE